MGNLNTANQQADFRIMVVDDNKVIVTQIRAIIQMNTSFTVNGFTDPVKAIQEFRQTPCHLLITDISMPFVDGFELIKRLLDQRPNCHCIIVTGHNTLQMVSRAQRCGASAIFFKPVAPKELLLAVNASYEKFQYWLNLARIVSNKEDV